MPKIKIDKVISFSSEDPAHAASNILSNDPSKKWKCLMQGEKSANLVLQLEEASVISSIDIGNEHSAYIEVLVNRSGSDDDFKVLLVMSSFMSPLEARQSTNINKVRMFTSEQLAQPEKDEKWDRVKIVCTQPFNRHVTYGLSFITFHTSGKDAVTTPQVTQVGKFVLRPDSPNNITVGSLFARKKELQNDKPITAAAAIRTASLSPQQSSQSSKKIKLPQIPTTTKDITIPQLSRKRDEILYSKDEEEPNEKIDYVIEQKKKEKEEAENKNISNNNNKQKIDDKTDTNTKPEKVKIEKKVTDNDKLKQSKNNESFKRKLNASSSKPNKKVKNQLTKPFHELLHGVVIVISGIQNPDRGDIRAMALSMGAKYKGDWDNTSTHLICAFPNTPKFNQVRGKGKIVTKKWIIDCNTERKRLPWRRYALDKNDQGKAESEDEICEEVEKINDQNDNENRDAKSGSDTEDEIERINTLQRQKNSNNSDSEDQTERIPLLNRKNTITKITAGTSSSSETHNVYDCDTDEENHTSGSYTEYPQLPNFFENTIFYIDNNLKADERKLLLKYISACNGTITKSITDSINFVISDKDHKLQLSNGCSHTVIVNPNFVYECYNAEKLIPVDDFII